MGNLRILVFSASFGAGHIRAADAVIEAIRRKEPSAHFSHLDFVVLISKTLNSLIKTIYIQLIKYTPKIWGHLYYGGDKVPQSKVLQQLLTLISKTRLIKTIYSLKPDVIICTHPTVAGILSQLKLNRLLGMPLVTVITDYVVHRQWIHPGIDLYIVGSVDVYKGLVSRGVKPQRIKVTGIPVSLKFESNLDRPAIINKLGLLPDRPTVLIMGGAYGVLNSAKSLCENLAKMEFPIQSIVVCGQDEKLYHSLDGIVDEARNPILRLGYVDNVDELMTAADLIITKAGGLTVSEALTKRLPLIIFKPIPGQEEENTIFVTKIGAGLVASTPEEVEEILITLCQHPDELHKMRLAAAQAIPGRAAERAANYILELVEKTSASKVGSMVLN